MNEESLSLFRTLTELKSPPGFEGPVREVMRRELERYSDEVISDRLGGVFGVRRGAQDGPKVMVAGHMDEVGFLITKITDNGLLRFLPLGGWWNQVLLAQQVEVITESGAIPGVIASIPPHNLTEEERKKPVELKNMLIDIGADDRQDAERIGVRPGQPVVPVCPFTPMANEKKVMAKAWDNRYGCGLAIELLKELAEESLPNTLYSGATVQEEVGLRGAKTAAYMIQPDLFYALDASPADDINNKKDGFGRLGDGALIRILDRSMVTHRGMRDFVLDIAETHDIPYQFFVSKGGTDAGSVHISGSGVPSAVIGICSRYIHTSASIIHTDDYAAARELLVRLVRASDKNALETILQSG